MKIYSLHHEIQRQISISAGENKCDGSELLPRSTLELRFMEFYTEFSTWNSRGKHFIVCLVGMGESDHFCDLPLWTICASAILNCGNSNLLSLGQSHPQVKEIWEVSRDILKSIAGNLEVVEIENMGAYQSDRPAKDDAKTFWQSIREIWVPFHSD